MPQVPEKFIFDVKQIIISEDKSNDIYMSVELIILDSLTNLNNVRFTKEFIGSVEKNKSRYIGTALVAEQDKLDEKKTKNLTHKYKNKKLSTQMIGSFVDFRTQENSENSDVLELVGEARILKRFPKTCETIAELYDDNNLKFSYEVLAGSITIEGKVKIIDEDDSNNFIGSCIVSQPAVKSSVATLLVASIEEDLNIYQGGEEVDRIETQEQFFANTKIIAGELDLSQVQKKVYTAIREQLGDKYWSYWSTEMGINYIILQQYDTGDYYRYDFVIGDDSVTLSEMYGVDKNWTRKKSKKVEKANEEDDNEMAAKKTMTKDEMIKKFESMSEEKMLKMMESAEVEVDVSEVRIKDLEKQLAEKDITLAAKEIELVSVTEKVNTLSASVITKDQEIATLQTLKTELDVIKAEKEKVEQASKKVALKEKYSKLFNAETIILPEIAEAIESLNEQVLQAKVTELALAAAEKDAKKDPKSDPKKTILASRITDNIEIAGSDPTSLKSKYSL